MTQFDPNIAAEAFPLSPEQARVHGRPVSEAVLLARWELRGDAPSHRIEKGLTDVIARHEILRTVFAPRGDTLEQIVLPVADLKLDTVDLRALPIDDHNDRISAIAQKMAAAPFDRTSAPLLRATLVRTAPQRAALLIAAHRAVADDMSAQVLARDLVAAMSGARPGVASSWPDLDLQVADYALWAEACQEAASHGEDHTYWADTLSGLRPTRLQGDGPGGAVQHERVQIPLPPRFGMRLTQGAEARGCGLTALVIAAISQPVSRLTRSSELVLLYDEDARNDAALAPLIGPFARPLPLRLATPPSVPLGTHLAHVTDVLEGARAHLAYPFEAIVEASGQSTDRAECPLSDVGVAVRDGEGARLEGTGFTLERDLPAPHPQGRTLQITLAGTAFGHSILIDYDASRHSRAGALDLGAQVRESLERFIDATEATPLALLGTADTTPSAQRATASARPTWTIVPMRDGSATSPVILTVNQPHLYRNFAMGLTGDVTVVNLAVADAAALARQKEIGYDALIDEAVDQVTAAFSGRALCVIGQCVDGLSALHIAQRCDVRGANSALAVLLDAWAPALSAPQQSAFARRLDQLSHARKRHAYYIRQFLSGRMSLRMLMMRNRVGRRILHALGQDADTTNGAELLLAVNAFHVEVGNRVPFPGWDGNVITFASDSQKSLNLETLFNWQDLLRRDTPIFHVAGWHEDALQYASHGDIARIVEARLMSILAQRPR